MMCTFNHKAGANKSLELKPSLIYTVRPVLKRQRWKEDSVCVCVGGKSNIFFLILCCRFSMLLLLKTIWERRHFFFSNINWCMCVYTDWLPETLRCLPTVLTLEEIGSLHMLDYWPERGPSRIQPWCWGPSSISQACTLPTESFLQLL